MALSEEKVQQLLQEIVNEAKLGFEIKAVVHREDNWDYLVVLGTVHYTDVREKLMNDFDQFRHADARKEIIFKLKHPMELEEWQKEEFGIKDEKAQTDDRTVIDDSDKNDWIGQ